MKAPKYISADMMHLQTHYDKMDGSERTKVFRAYSYDYSKQRYELKNDMFLDQEIIRKLVWSI